MQQPGKNGGVGTARRRGLRYVGRLLVAAALLGLAGAPSADAFGFDDVVTRARDLAGTDYEEPSGDVPKWLLDVTYDQWRDIRFRPAKALWGGSASPFTVQFFHPGLFYDRTVAIHVIDAEGVHRVPFSPGVFDYGQNDFASRVPQDLGFAGFRVHYPLNRPDYHDEVIVFLGASYFRVLGRGQVFGASARGLAIDTAFPSGEEFPWFREFWLVRPGQGADALEIYALLDGPSLAGAYRFVVWPGKETRVSVETRVFPRRELGKLGVAPLTSMFFHGENTLRPIDDFRPESHDSDGLLLHHEGGEWLWRPVDNPEELRVRSFRMTNPKGFGLLQRDRDFDHYQDLETRQELRPGVWIVPKGEWGEGRVELVEIPTDSDANDNVIAYWVPERPVEPKTPLAAAYDMFWFLDDPARPPGGRVVATRRDHPHGEDSHRFVVDFEDDALRRLREDMVVRGVITIGSGREAGDELLEQQVVKNPVTGGWRLSFVVRATDEAPLELRAFLQKEDDVLTETWSYTVP